MASQSKSKPKANTFLRTARQRLAPWIVPLVLLVLWQASAQWGWLSNRILPAPLDVAKSAVALARSGELWTHVAVSTWRALLGFVIGGSLGLALGLLTGTFRTAETLLDTTLQMVRNIPVLALIPLVILWFGIDESAKLFLVSLGVFFPIYLNTYHGIRSVDPALVEMARSYGLSRAQLYREVILPGALPQILVGVRFSLGLMWVTLIVAETVSAQAGIGYMTMNAREFLADRCGAAGHPAVCAARQAGGLVVARAGTLPAALAPRVSSGGLRLNWRDACKAMPLNTPRWPAPPCTSNTSSNATAIVKCCMASIWTSRRASLSSSLAAAAAARARYCD